MKIVVVGLGHAGLVNVAGLLQGGHVVIGVDTDEELRGCVARGSTPFCEPGVAALIATGYATGRLSVTSDIADEADADLIFICVGTPGLSNGDLDLSGVTAVARSLGDTVRRRARHLPPLPLVFRSTMLPGSMNNTVLPTIIQTVGEPPGVRYEVAYNPDFTREGNALADYFAPARTIVGERTPGSARALHTLYSGIGDDIFVTSFEVAELVKFVDNAFHALKITFANEIGRFALQSHISPSEVFNLFLSDTKLNLSAAYLQPGGPFGGACLPKDVRALSTRMNDVGIISPVLGHVLESNSLHSEFLIREVERHTAGSSRILLVGLSFKSGTDDFRESPYVDLAQTLLERGHNLSIYDPDIRCDGTAGLPSQLSSLLLTRIPPSVAWDVVILAKNTPELSQVVGTNCPIFQIDQLLFAPGG